jgi:hypothetical protein
MPLSTRFLFHAVLSFLLFASACASIDAKKRGNEPILDEKTWLKPGLLTSERIQEKFGSFFVQVLLQDELSGIRFSNLYSLEKGEKITRVLALVNFVNDVDPRLQGSHKEILDGKSLGATLAKHGLTVQKHIMFKGVFDGFPRPINAMMNVTETSFAALMYDVTVKINNDIVPYCTITEVYSPDFLSIRELESLYAQSMLINDATSHVHEQVTAATSSEKIKENYETIKAILRTL